MDLISASKCLVALLANLTPGSRGQGPTGSDFWGGGEAVCGKSSWNGCGSAFDSSEAPCVASLMLGDIADSWTSGKTPLNPRIQGWGRGLGGMMKPMFEGLTDQR